MALEDYKNANDLGKTDIRGKRINEEDLRIFVRGQSEVVFGTNENDIIEVALYDDANNLLKWSLKDPSQPVASTGERQQMGYPDEIILDPAFDINELGYGNGRYKISYSFLQNVFGSADEKSRAYISEISPSRTEIRILPLITGNVEKDQETKNSFNRFKNFGINSQNWQSIINNNFNNQFVEDIIKSMDEQLLSQYLTEFEMTRDQLQSMLISIKDNIRTQLLTYVQAEQGMTLDRFKNLFYTVVTSELSSKIPPSAYNSQDNVYLQVDTQTIKTLEDTNNRVNQEALDINYERINPVLEWSSLNLINT